MAQKRDLLFNYCPRCGHQLRIGGGRRKLECRNCGYHRALGRDTDQVDHHPLKGGVSLDGFTRGLGLKLKSYQCEGCGVAFARKPQAQLDYCPYCRSKELSETTRDTEIIYPAGIVPFTRSEQQARAQLAARFSSRFLPNPIKALLQPEEVHGIYIPIFLHDALTRSTWQGETNLRVVQVYQDKPVERKAWEPTVGYYEHFFENVPLTHCLGVQDPDQFEAIDDWDLGRTIPYDPGFIEDFHIELYQVDEMSTFEEADRVMSGHINAVARSRALGDEVRRFKVTSEKFALGFRLVLVPLWVGVFHYQGEMYQYLINGQTGSEVGEQPLSTQKMLVAGGVGVVLIALLGLLLG